MWLHPNAARARSVLSVQPILVYLKELPQIHVICKREPFQHQHPPNGLSGCFLYTFSIHLLCGFVGTTHSLLCAQIKEAVKYLKTSFPIDIGWGWCAMRPLKSRDCRGKEMIFCQGYSISAVGCRLH